MRIKLFSLLTVVFLSTSLFAKATGEELFKQCKACHTLTEDRLVGPGLAGVTEKRDHEWLKSWIRSSTKFIASGDVDAIALFEEFKIPMADYDLSDEDMESLLSFMAGDKAVEEVVTESVTEEASAGYSAEDVTKAEGLFTACKACHTLTEDRLVGPGLAGVTEKRNHEWLKSWITSSTKFIASGDADAIALFDEFKIPMADYDFSDEDMELLLAYLAGEVKVVEKVAKVEVATEEIPEELAVVEKVEDESDWAKALKNRPLTKWLFGISIFLLFGVLIAAIKLYRTTKEA